MALTLIFSLTALISIMITISPSMSSAETPAKGFEARLIHRDSPESPLYNPNATYADLIESARRRSTARQNYFKWLMSGKEWGSYISAPLDKDNGHGDYIMGYKIGTPRVDAFGYFDTGSGLIWLQCQPCEKCYQQPIPIFDPAKSDSYEKVMCGSNECSTTEYSFCVDPIPSECLYRDSDFNGSTQGVLAMETIMLEDGNTNLTKMIFGCGHINVNINEGDNPPGVVGLNRLSSSLVGQISLSQFSYCISSSNGTIHSSVKFGLQAVITETQTPLLSGKYGFYYLSLEGIGVDGTLLNISRSAFTMNPKLEGAVIMDSRTTFTSLPPEAFLQLKQGIIDALSDLHPIADSDGLCYDDSRFQVDKTPEIAFYFTGLEFPLSAANTWVMNAQGHYCLAIGQSAGPWTMFGLYQFRDVNVGYDLDKNFASFKYTNCQ